MPSPTTPVAAARPDSAVRGILFSNAVTLLIAWWAGDGLLLLLWPYWAQSVVIGWFAQRRLRRLRDFRTDGVRINGRAASPTPETARWTANFFIAHYGLFHLVYAVFLITFTVSGSAQGIVPVFDADTGEFGRFILGRLDGVDAVCIVVAAASFLWTHAASHREHVEADLRGRPHLGTLMFLPYARIIPMHLTIILGTAIGGSTPGLLLFGALKTAADVVMHVVEHRVLQRGAAASA